MRQTAFRAWDKVSKLMCEVVTIDFLDGSIEVRRFPHGTTILYNEYVLMQYTGIKDSNGKEVYEGDIYKYINTNYGYGDPKQPEYLTDVLIGIEQIYGDDDIYNTLCHGEVIGNIYETPGLLNYWRVNNERNEI